jgi:hypothetical protein
MCQMEIAPVVVGEYKENVKLQGLWRNDALGDHLAHTALTKAGRKITGASVAGGDVTDGGRSIGINGSVQWQVIAFRPTLLWRIDVAGPC